MSNILAFSLVLLVFQYMYNHEMTFGVRQCMFHVVHPVWTTQFLSVFGPPLFFFVSWWVSSMITSTFANCNSDLSFIFNRVSVVSSYNVFHKAVEVHWWNSDTYCICCCFVPNIFFLVLLLKVTELYLIYLIVCLSVQGHGWKASHHDCGYSCRFCNTHCRCCVS